MSSSGDLVRPYRADEIAGIILAGGKNTRMGGRDKAFLHVGGRTVFERTLSVLRGCFAHVLVVSNDVEKFASFDVETTKDELPSLGPLSGLHAGLGRIRAPYAFVVACDMPFLSREPIRFLVSRVCDQEAVVPCWDGDIEPLHAVYATSLRPRIAEAVAAGARAVRDLLPLIRVEYVPEAVMSKVRGAEESLRNVNTPEDAARFAVQL
jgi:molybdopterin-guanine dinucleotide biosynthesis protein A